MDFYSAFTSSLYLNYDQKKAAELLFLRPSELFLTSLVFAFVLLLMMQKGCIPNERDTASSSSTSQQYIIFVIILQS